jgi:hypothetical protein
MTYIPYLEPYAALGSGPVENRYQYQAWKEYEHYLWWQLWEASLSSGELDRWADDGGRA